MCAPNFLVLSLSSFSPSAFFFFLLAFLLAKKTRLRCALHDHRLHRLDCKAQRHLTSDNAMPIATLADLKKKSYKKKKPNPPSESVKNAPCTRCGRTTHLASTCTNKTHIDGRKIAKEEKYCRDCGDDISEAPKHHKQCYDCWKGIEKKVWEKLNGGEKVRGATLMTKEEGGRDSPPMFAGRCVEREKLTESYLQTELDWNEESKKRKLEEDMKPIVLDDDDDDEKEKEKEKERKKKAERRRVMLERAKKRLLGFREPVDKDKKEEGDARAEEWEANENPFWQPPMYVPAEGPCVEDFEIFTDEHVEVRDMGMQWHGKFRACLDTGNAGCTLIQKHVAQVLGLCDALGRPTESRWEKQSVHGVVAGASEMIYMCTLTYRLKGKEITCRAGITHARLGCDLLIARREIQEFERSGYTFKA